MALERLSKAATATIANGQTQSSEVAADGMAMATMKMPASAAASYTFQSKLSGSDTLQNVVDASGSPVSIVGVNDSKARIPDEVFPCLEFVIVANAAVVGDTVIEVLVAG